MQQVGYGGGMSISEQWGLITAASSSVPPRCALIGQFLLEINTVFLLLFLNIIVILIHRPLLIIMEPGFFDLICCDGSESLTRNEDAAIETRTLSVPVQVT